MVRPLTLTLTLSMGCVVATPDDAVDDTASTEATGDTTAVDSGDTDLVVETGDSARSETGDTGVSDSGDTAGMGDSGDTADSADSGGDTDDSGDTAAADSGDTAVGDSGQASRDSGDTSDSGTPFGDTGDTGDTDVSGSCSSPIPLAVGSAVQGTTAPSADRLDWSAACAADAGGFAADGPDDAYDVTSQSLAWLRHDLTALDGQYVALYLQGACGDDATSLHGACALSSAGGSVSVTTLVNPGVHTVVVDGFAGGAAPFGGGAYSLSVQPTFAPSCHGQVPTTLGAWPSGVTVTADDTANGTPSTTWMGASCGAGMLTTGAERIYAFALNQADRVQIDVTAVTPSTSAFGVYVRSTCEDRFSEEACTEAVAGAATLTADLPAGVHFVFVDDFSGATDTTQSFDLTITLP